MSTLIRYVSVVLVVALLSACSGDDYGNFQKALDENIALWEAQDLADYAFEYRVSCYCEPRHNHSLIEAGEVIRSYDAINKEFHPNDELEEFATVEALFALIQHAIDREASALEVEFNDELGYPEYVYVDFDFGIADEEVSYRVVDFKSSEYTEVQYYLDIAKRAWDAEYYTDYSFNYSLDCFCSPILQNIDVQVVAGAVSSATDENDQPVSAQDLESVPTIDELFGFIQQWIDDEAEELVVQFDEQTGFPLSVYANVQVGASDDEFTYTLASFAPDLSISNQNKLDANSELWLEEGRASYHYVVETEETGELREYWITVVNNAATEGHYHEGSAHIDINPNSVLANPTLTDYFAFIQESIDLPADIIVVDYSKRYGFPVSIWVDPDATVAGDELEYFIRVYL